MVFIAARAISDAMGKRLDSDFSCRVGVLTHHDRKMVGEYTRPTNAVLSILRVDARVTHEIGGQCPPYD
jgi:hypothetical protein